MTTTTDTQELPSRRRWLWPAITAVAAILVIGTFAWLIGNLQVTTDRLQNRPDNTSQVTQLQRTVANDNTEITALKTQLNAVQGKLNSASPTGNLISCTDLRLFQQIFQVQGVDSAGGTVYSSEPGQPWEPVHCLK